MDVQKFAHIDDKDVIRVNRMKEFVKSSVWTEELHPILDGMIDTLATHAEQSQDPVICFADTKAKAMLRAFRDVIEIFNVE